MNLFCGGRLDAGVPCWGDQGSLTMYHPSIVSFWYPYPSLFGIRIPILPFLVSLYPSLFWYPHLSLFVIPIFPFLSSPCFPFWYRFLRSLSFPFWYQHLSLFWIPIFPFLVSPSFPFCHPIFTFWSPYLSLPHCRFFHHGDSVVPRWRDTQTHPISAVF